MREFQRLSIAILLISALAWAGEPWESKPYDKWNKKDVERVLDHSPWATVISVPQTWGETTRTLTTGTSVMVQMPVSEAQAVQARSAAAAAVASATAPQVPFEARGVSAQVMRQAMARQLLLAGKLNEASLQQFLSQPSSVYQIDVLGPNMTPFNNLDETALAEASLLRLDEAKVTLTPISVRVIRSPDGKAVTGIVFSFPEVAEGKPTIPTGETGLDFVYKTKLLTLKFHFDPRKMMMKQQRDL